MHRKGVRPNAFLTRPPHLMTGAPNAPRTDGSPASRSRLVVVSNRLPLSLERDGDEWAVETSTGGLVTALTPVLRERGGLWIGWPGVVDEDGGREDGLGSVLEQESEDGDFRICPVTLSREERDGFYYGFSNEIAWPLFHGFVARCNFQGSYWETYREVNRRFAAAVAEASEPDDLVWIHDYHLMSVADALRKAGVRRRTAFYLHIPFPHPEVLKALPWREEVIHGLLRYDHIGFQTERDRLNFLECVEELVLAAPGAAPDAEIEEAARRARSHATAIPVSIDPMDFVGAEGSDEVRRSMTLKGDEPERLKLMLGVDRLDYSKGIPHKLRGLQRALQRFPELRGRITLIQLVVPSRENIPEYRQMKEEIEQLVGEINGEFTTGGWVPIHYLYRSWKRDELLAHYQAADIGLVTPLRDGMNLVAKEFVVASDRDRGVLVLSEFAGAVEQLRDGAVLVNPYDVEGVARAICEAFRMEREERARRLEVMRARIWEMNAYEWVDRALGSLERGSRVDEVPSATRERAGPSRKSEPPARERRTRRETRRERAPEGGVAGPGSERTLPPSPPSV